MKKFKYLLYPTLLLFFSTAFFPSCKSPKSAETTTKGAYRLAFYNIENLFDTLDQVDKADEEFTPTGKKQWNTERYYDKLGKLSKVIESMEYPSILGLCEVENEAVLKDLTNETSLKNHDYKIVHFESPDGRGIDNALIFKQNDFKLIDSKKIRINFPDSIEADYTSRDIVYAKGKLAKNEIVHIFVNHWPSRRGGLKESEPKRTFVASHLRKAVDDIFAKTPNANIIIIGDFNDETDNKSVLETLGAKNSNENLEANSLYSCMAKLDQDGLGTYRYRGNWNMLDNIIVSTPFLMGNSKISATNPTIFQENWMMYDDPKYGLGPSRSYGGPNYYGGYSDHLPIFVDIVIK